MSSTESTVHSSIPEEAALELLFRAGLDSAQALTLIDQGLEQSSSSSMPEDQRSEPNEMEER